MTLSKMLHLNKQPESSISKLGAPMLMLNDYFVEIFEYLDFVDQVNKAKMSTESSIEYGNGGMNTNF